MSRELHEVVDVGGGRIKRSYKSVGSSSGGGTIPAESELYETSEKTGVAVGGLPEGSVIYGKTPKQVLESMLFPYQAPTLSFAISPNKTIYETGDKITKLTLSITVGKKSKGIQSIKVYDNSTLVTTIIDGVGSGGVFNYIYNCNISANTKITVEITDGDTNVVASKTISFVNKSFYGYVPDGTTITEDTIVNLQWNSLKSGKSLTYSGITCANSKVVYAYPKSFGKLSSILDANGFNYIDSYDLSTISVDSVDYYVYTMKDAATLDNFKQIYS